MFWNVRGLKGRMSPLTKCFSSKYLKQKKIRKNSSGHIVHITRSFLQRESLMLQVSFNQFFHYFIYCILYNHNTDNKSLKQNNIVLHMDVIFICSYSKFVNKFLSNTLLKRIWRWCKIIILTILLLVFNLIKFFPLDTFHPLT